MHISTLDCEHIRGGGDFDDFLCQAFRHSAHPNILSYLSVVIPWLVASKIIRTLAKTDLLRDDLTQQQLRLLKNFLDMKYGFERALQFCMQLIVNESDACEVISSCTCGRTDSVRIILLAASVAHASTCLHASCEFRIAYVPHQNVLTFVNIFCQA